MSRRSFRGHWLVPRVDSSAGNPEVIRLEARHSADGIRGLVPDSVPQREIFALDEIP